MSSPKRVMESMPNWATQSSVSATSGLIDDAKEAGSLGVKFLAGEFIHDDAADLALVAPTGARVGVQFTVSDGHVTATYKITSICCSMCTCQRTGTVTIAV